MRRAELILDGLDALADVAQALREVSQGLASPDDIRPVLGNAKVTCTRCAHRLRVAFATDPDNPLPTLLEEARDLFTRIGSEAGQADPSDLQELDRIITAYEQSGGPHVAPASVPPLITVDWRQLRRLLPGA